MKKIISLLLLLIIPLSVKAAGICGNSYDCSLYSEVYPHGTSGSVAFKNPGRYGWVSSYTYSDSDGRNLLCLDAIRMQPHFLNYARSLNLDGSLDSGLALIYRLYLLDGGRDLTTASEAMRLFVVASGNALKSDIEWMPVLGSGINDSDLLVAFRNAGKTLAGYSVSGETINKNSVSSARYNKLQKWFCAALNVANSSLGNSSACQNAISDLDLSSSSLLLQNNFNIKLVEDTTSMEEPTVVDDVYSRKITFKVSSTGYNNLMDLLDEYPELKNSSKIKVKRCSVNNGFSCKVVNSSSNILETGTVDVIISGRVEDNSETDAEITINYSFTFPYDYDSMNILGCEGAWGCIGRTFVDAGYNPWAVTQRMFVVKNAQDLKDTVTTNITIPAYCKYEEYNGWADYLLLGQSVSALTYMQAGCCEDINPNLIKDETALIYYKNNCMEQDIVYFENKCGATSCNDSNYVDYTHSYIWQLPMDKILSRVKTLETSPAYAEDISGVSNNQGVVNNTDKSYLANSISGKTGSAKEGTTLNPISAGNNYCMLYTSEENDIYFPGTATSTSGQYFVFNELNREECLSAPNPSSSCFRQPYIVGQIYATMHTNIVKWEKDYLAAINEEKNLYNRWQSSGSSADKRLYDIAKTNRENLEKYKTECEEHNDLKSYWNYNMEPSLTFTYKQKVYGGTQRIETITEEVEMDISKDAVKYWPHVSTNPEIIANSEIGRENRKTYNISYGNIYETKSFDQTEDYKIGYKQTIYYKPQQMTYAILPTGEYVLDTREWQNTNYLLEHGVEIGYVYNVRLTTYQGKYTTSFTIDDVGHSGINSYSNIQNTLDAYKSDNNLSELDSECVYCNEEGEFKRQCEECPPEPELEASYVYRTVSLNDVTPNDRANTNWSDAKGASAEERIQRLSGASVVAYADNYKRLNNKEEIDSAKILSEATKTESKIDVLATDNIYDDSTKEYLEYDFTLTTKDMQIIKKNNARAEFDYGTMTFCTGTSNITVKSEDADYCFTCNQDGKECTSTFIDAFANPDITAITRVSKWKYYINNEWKFGSMSTISDFENGRYPDPLNHHAYLNIYSNWP